MSFQLDPDYKSVPERLADFLAKHPEGSLQPVNPARPYRVETIGDATFIVYAAAAYRTPDDPRPGIGTAWEPFPGKTTYTRDSELQNAETSAWGRALVAVLASSSKSIASAEDVRNRNVAAEPREPSFTNSADRAGRVCTACHATIEGPVVRSDGGYRHKTCPAPAVLPLEAAANGHAA